MHSVYSGSMAQLVSWCNTPPHGRPELRSKLEPTELGTVTEVMLLSSALDNAAQGRGRAVHFSENSKKKGKQKAKQEKMHPIGINRQKYRPHVSCAFSVK